MPPPATHQGLRPPLICGMKCGYLPAAMVATKASTGKDPHAQGTTGKGASEAHGATNNDEEDLVRTPVWLPFLGLGLLMAGALASYLWVYPGTLNTPTVSDGGDGGDASSEAAVPTAAPAPHPAAAN